MLQPRNHNSLSRGLLILFLAFVVQGALILSLAKRSVIGYYPLNFDQTWCLMNAYNLYEQSIGKNLWVMLFTDIWKPTANGALILPEAVFSMYLFGPGRMACLAVNLAHFFAAQLCVWLCLRKFTRSTPAAWSGVGFFLMAGFPFFWAGGLLDFRFDLASVCLFTVVLSLTIASDFFLNKKILPWLIVAVTVLILTRFITAVYWFGITALTFIYLIKSRDRRRFRNLMVLSLSVSLLVAPILFYNAKSLYKYYGVRHLIGPEKEIRAKEFGATDLRASLAYYPKSLWRDHLGAFPLAVVMACSLLALGNLLFVARRRKNRNVINYDFAPKQDEVGWYFLGFSFIVPLLVLTADTSKSPVVGAILFPPIMLLVTLVLFYWQRWFCFSQLYHAVTRGLFVIGVAVFFNNSAQPQAQALQYAYAKSINKFYEEIFRVVERIRIAKPKLVFLEFNDALNAQSLNVWLYEKEGRLLNAKDTLRGILPLNPQEIKQGLDSAFIIVSPDKVCSGVYPYYDSIRSQWGPIQEYLRKEATLLTAIPLRDELIEYVYVKNNIYPVGYASNSKP